MGFRGRLAKVYYDDNWDDGEDDPTSAEIAVATSSGTGTEWTEVKKAVDLSFAGGESDGDGSSRESDVNMDVGAGQDWTITMQYRLDQLTDTVYEKFVTSKLNYTPIMLMFLNGAHTTTNTKGWYGPYRAKEISEDMPNDGATIATITLVPFPGRLSTGVLYGFGRVTAA